MTVHLFKPGSLFVHERLFCAQSSRCELEVNDVEIGSLLVCLPMILAQSLKSCSDVSTFTLFSMPVAKAVCVGQTNAVYDVEKKTRKRNSEL
jgi:hypothetical protein